MTQPTPTTHGESPETDPKVIDGIRTFILEMSDPKAPEFLRCFVFSLSQAGESGDVPRKTRALCEDLVQLDKLGGRRTDLAESFAAQFYQAALVHASMHLRPQLFSVVASNSKDPADSGVDTYAFRIIPPPNSDGGFGVEGPMGQGDKALMLRLVEISLKESRADRADSRIAVEKAATRMESLFMSTLAKNEFLETSRMALYKEFQESMNQQAERQMRFQKELIEAQRTERHWRLAEAEIPRLLDNMTGASVSRFFKAMKAEHVQGLLAMCPPEMKEELKAAISMHRGLDLQNKPAPVVKEVKTHGESPNGSKGAS